MYRVKAGGTWSYVPDYCWGHLKLCTGLLLGAPEAMHRFIAGGTWSYVLGQSWGHLKLCTGSELGSPKAMYRVRAGVTWSYVPDYCWGHLKLFTGSELGSPEAMYRVIVGVTWSYVPDYCWGYLKPHEVRLTLYGQEKHSLLWKWPLLWTHSEEYPTDSWLECDCTYRVIRKRDMFTHDQKQVGQAVKDFSWDNFLWMQ